MLLKPSLELNQQKHTALQYGFGAAKVGNIHEAIKAYQHAIVVLRIDAYNNLGILLEVGELEQAEFIYRKRLRQS